MADKNRNGVDDRLENRPYQTSKGFGNSLWDMSGFGGGRTYAPTQYNKPGILGLGEVGNFITDRSRDLDNFWDSHILGNERPEGGGLGDYRYGRAPSRGVTGAGGFLSGARAGAAGQGVAPRQAPSPVGDTALPSFMSFFQQAMEQAGGPGHISYDPLRQDARNRGTEYDARIQAMYNQLASTMRDDGADLQQNYQGAIDDTAARTAATQQAIQAAYDAAASRNDEVRRNLGIEAAQGNIIQGGRDLNTQAAESIADAASRGQITGDALARNQQAAGDNNTNLVSAAGMEGNRQRARVQSELASLLAQYDMQEQEANRQAQQQSMSQAMGLANVLYDEAWRNREYQDNLDQWLYEQQSAAMQPQRTDPMQYSLNFIGQLQQQFPDLDMETLLKMLGPAASIGKLAN